MKTLSPEHRPLEYSVQSTPSPTIELGAMNGITISGPTGIRRKGYGQTEMGVRHPGNGHAFLRRISGSAHPIVVLILGLVALLVISSSATSQMTGDLELALSMHKSGKLRDAIDFYSEAIRKNPKSAEAYNWRGIAYDDLGETDKALQDFDTAIDISPNYADAYNNRGEIRRKKKMYREAVSDYSKAVQLESNFAEAYYNLGVVSEAENKPGAAAANYENYLKHKPDASDKSEVETKIKTLRQAAPATQRPGSSPVAQKPEESKPAQPQAAPKPTAPGAGRPAVPPKAAVPGGGMQGMPGMPNAPGIPGMPPNMPNIPGMPPGISPDMLISMVTGIGILSIIIEVALYLFVSAMLFLIAKKTNTTLPWLAFVPIAQIVLALNIAGKPLWWFLLLLLPVALVPLAIAGGLDPTGGTIVQILAAIILLIWAVVILFICIGIARARGKSVIWGILLFLFPCVLPGLIALAYLGLSE
jgi:tetratricopeptide (TPR) repeat protein